MRELALQVENPVTGLPYTEQQVRAWEIRSVRPPPEVLVRVMDVLRLAPDSRGDLWAKAGYLDVGQGID